jgi:hypothetical protein
MTNHLTGYLFYTDYFGWQLKYYFGKGQSKNLHIHTDSLDYVNQNGVEGNEVKFEIKGCEFKSSLNGAISCGLILEDNS